MPPYLPLNRHALRIRNQQHFVLGMHLWPPSASSSPVLHAGYWDLLLVAWNARGDLSEWHCVYGLGAITTANCEQVL